MVIKDFEDSLTEILHLNGEYLGAEVGGRVNSQKDIKTLCHIVLDLCGYIKRQDRKIKVLKRKVEKCYMNTAVQDVKVELNGT